VSDLLAPGEKLLGTRSLLLAAHGYDVPRLGPAVGCVCADLGEDLAVGCDLLQLVPERVELGVGNLGLTVVIQSLVLTRIRRSSSAARPFVFPAIAW
jgi:hypothetical protein